MTDLYCAVKFVSMTVIYVNFVSTIEVESRSVEFISVIETSNVDCVCTILTFSIHSCLRLYHDCDKYAIV